MLFPLRPANKLIFLQSIMCDVFGVWEAPPGCNVMADRVTECARCRWCAPGAEVLLWRSARWMVTRSLWWQPPESPTRKALCLLRWPPRDMGRVSSVSQTWRSALPLPFLAFSPYFWWVTGWGSWTVVTPSLHVGGAASAPPPSTRSPLLYQFWLVDAQWITFQLVRISIW